MTDLEEAIGNCKYARSLGEVALQQHLESWASAVMAFDDEDYNYYLSVMEIKQKLDTEECLLKEV